MDTLTDIYDDFAAKTAADWDALILSVLPERDRMVIEAMPQHMLPALKHRGQMVKYPDGREVFTWDGRELLMFWPMTIGVEGDAIAGYKLVMRQRVQKLEEDIP